MEDSRISLVSTRVFMVIGAPQNGCHHHLCPQGELHLPPVSLEGLPRSASGSDTGPFQITAYALVLGACVIFHAPFYESSLYFLWLSCLQAPLAFKVRHSSSQCRSTIWGSNSFLLEEKLCSCDYLPISGPSS